MEKLDRRYVKSVDVVGTSVAVSVFRVIAVIALVLSTMVAGMAMWITPSARADESTPGDGTATTSENNSGIEGTSATITENITDTENLLGANLSDVSDMIATTKKNTGVTVKLLYLADFDEKKDVADWAEKVMTSMNPAPNTVMLSIASNDGRMVVTVSQNSDQWLRDGVNKMSDAANGPLLKSKPDWSGSAIAMMKEIQNLKSTSTSSSSMVIGVVVMGVVLVLLIAVIVATVVIRRRRAAGKGRRPRGRHGAGAHAGTQSKTRSGKRSKAQSGRRAKAQSDDASNRESKSESVDSAASATLLDSVDSSAAAVSADSDSSALLDSSASTNAAEATNAADAGNAADAADAIK